MGLSNAVPFGHIAIGPESRRVAGLQSLKPYLISPGSSESRDQQTRAAQDPEQNHLEEEGEGQVRAFDAQVMGAGLEGLGGLESQISEAKQYIESLLRLGGRGAGGMLLLQGPHGSGKTQLALGLAQHYRRQPEIRASTRHLCDSDLFYFTRHKLSP